MTDDSVVESVEGGTFTAVGLEPEDERLYRALLSRPRWLLSEIPAPVGFGPAAVEAMLGRLERIGFVVRSAKDANCVVTVPPEVAVEIAALERMAAIQRARGLAPALDDVFRRGDHGGSRFELVPAEVARGWFRAFVAAARAEVLCLGAPAGERPIVVGCHRSVSVRVIHDRAHLEAGSGVPGTRGHRGGEEGEVRIVDALPVPWFAVVDRVVAVAPLAPAAGGDEGCVVVRQSSLVASFAFMFETLWERAIPFGSSEGSAELDERDRRILELLAGGHKDRTVARHLGVSPATVDRRIRGITRRLGATTRFQAGLLASRRGWI